MEHCNSNSVFLYNGGTNFTYEPVASARWAPATLSYNPIFVSQRAAKVALVAFAASETFPFRIAVVLLFRLYFVNGKWRHSSPT